jgi:hypothetical protein
MIYTSIASGMEVKVTSFPVSCQGKSDGRIAVIISESHSAYIIRLLDAKNSRLINQAHFDTDTTFTFSNVRALDYKVQVVAVQNNIEKKVSVKEPEPLKANIIEAINFPSSDSSCDGKIIARPTGGTPPYTYNWSENTHNSNTQKVEGLCEGIYRCFITDASECEEVSATIYLINKLMTKD